MPETLSGLEDIAPGHYRLIRLLGRGGMGEVYLARDLTLDRDVAIKFLSPEKTADAEARRRLLREARATAALDHPGICGVYETGETPDGRAYIVMPYVEGETLADRLRRGPLPVAEALLLCEQIAEALDAAHARGIIHRDLKPGNVIVPPSGRPKLVDFGLAKLLSAASGDASTSGDGTSLGAVPGTPAYMSPEQVERRPLDGRSDLFSLGALLFECLTGRSAFGGATAFETIAAIVHADPPPVSSLRSGLTTVHDAFCRRLLDKNPEHRFQSAGEVVRAARLLRSDSSDTHPPDTPSDRPAWPRRRWTVSWRIPAAAGLLLLIVAGAWLWSRPARLPPAPPDADRWYRRGTEAIRDGAYHTGRLALEEAVRLFPQHALAYARLAEADAELDEERSAQRRLLRVSALVPDESRLPEEEHLRFQAIRALVLRDVDAAVAAHRQLVRRRPSDAGAWLDLGRAQEAAGLRADARESFGRARSIDPQYAAAYLRLGSLAMEEAQRDEAVAALDEAERLYRAASNAEGETQVLLLRGALFDATGELKAARVDLERALGRATAARSRHQIVRARLTLSSVTALEGRLAEAERLAAGAVQEATNAGLDTLAADGLVSLAYTLLILDRPDEAVAELQRAIRMAEDRGAARTAAKARLQLAALHQTTERPDAALAVVNDLLPFFRAGRYRRHELTALSIAARAQQRLGRLDEARRISVEVLAVADAVKDPAQIALASGNLASVLTTLGEYPEALSLRERAERVHRRLGDEISLPYALANRADLLIRLGRAAEATALLDEIERGIAAKRAAWIQHAGRVAYLRALAAATELRCVETIALARRVDAEEAGDTSRTLAGGLVAFCSARLGRAPRGATRPAGAAQPPEAHELRYWQAAAALERGDAGRALDLATEALSLLDGTANDELRWRVAAVGVAAGRLLNPLDARDHLLRAQQEALERLRARWGEHFASYVRRPDLAGLITRAGDA